MKLFTYNSKEEYHERQIDWAHGSAATRTQTWVEESDVIFLSNYLRENFNTSEFKMGICHGSKIGVENAWFEKHLGVETWGTDLGPGVDDAPHHSPYRDIINPDHNLQWDFHDIKDEWVDNVDFIYSNTLDHSDNPPHCLCQWMKCVKKTGACILEWTKWHSVDHANIGNPYGASLEEYQELVESNGFVVKEVLSKKFEPTHYFKKTGLKHFVIAVHP